MIMIFKNLTHIQTPIYLGQEFFYDDDDGDDDCLGKQ